VLLSLQGHWTGLTRFVDGNRPPQIAKRRSCAECPLLKS
jgi:hypothetical protein